MNTGVSTTSRPVSSTAARAREPSTVAWTENFTGPFYRFRRGAGSSRSNVHLAILPLLGEAMAPVLEDRVRGADGAQIAIGRQVTALDLRLRQTSRGAVC